MVSVVRCGVLCLLIGCGASSDDGSTHAVRQPPPGGPAEPMAETPASQIPRCGAPETRALTSYLDVTAGDGVARHIEVIRDPRNGVWMPAEHVQMPMHHATAIRWTNLDDLPLLAGATGERLRFSFLLLTRGTQQVPGEHEWRTEYTARVTTVCAVTDDASREVGVHVPDVDTPAGDCERLEDAVEAAARGPAGCTSDADCVVRDAPACELRGLGCYWMAVRRDADLAPVMAAIGAYETSGCPASDCDCPTAPTTARCTDGRCTAP